MVSQLHTVGTQDEDRKGELDWMVKYAVSMSSRMGGRDRKLPSQESKDQTIF